MKPCVVDASVVAAAFFQEPEAADAQRVLSSGRTLLAPDLICAEFANVLWKRVRRGEITAAEAAEMLSDFLKLPIEPTASRDLADLALDLAVRSGRTAYDCLYLALAIRSKALFLTCDKRLVNSLASGPLSGHVLHVSEA